MKKVYIFGLMACSLTACKPEIDQEASMPGTASFTRYLAVGGSETAGFADQTLYMSSQMNAYPALLAEQLKLVGGGNFNSPLLPTGDKGYPEPKLLLRNVVGFCDTVLTTIPEERGKDSTLSAVSIASAAPYNNFGIPGARAMDFIKTGYGAKASNLYANRFFQNPNTATPLTEAISLSPTFFTLSLGTADVINYAITGGEGSPSYISQSSDFRYALDSITTVLTRRDVKGVLLNIPDISTMPYFTTISPKGLILTQTQADELNVFYRDRNIPLRFVAGANNFVIQDGAGIRKINDDEMLLLSIPRDSLRCAKWGSAKPIPARMVLTGDEIGNVRRATGEYNAIIRDIAAAKNIAITDIDAYYRTIQSGMRFNGVGYIMTYINGGFFSLDGIHATPRGNALIANQIIRTINNVYGATIPDIDANKYSGVLLP